MRAYSSFKEIVSLVKKADSIGLVPTMGSLHDGHLSIIKKALIKDEIVIVSIYVNPKQFNDPGDLKKYPRNLKDDLEKLNDIRGDQHEAGWGRQIRSYVLQPYQQVKDSRSNLEVGNVQNVLDGDIAIFTKEYLKWRRQGIND